jgi:hypothetical protein
MSINTKIYIHIDQNTDLTVIRSTFTAISKGIKSLFPKDGGFLDNHVGHVSFSPENPYLGYVLPFKLHGDERRLTIMFDDMADSETIFQGQSIGLSLGMWGQSVEIMEAISKEMLKLPFTVESYLNEDDSTYEYRTLNK